MIFLQSENAFLVKLLDKPEWLILCVCILILAYKVVPYYFDKKRELAKIADMQLEINELKLKVKELEDMKDECNKLKGMLAALRKDLQKLGHDDLPI